MVESFALILFSYIKKNKTLVYDDEIYIYGLEIIVSTILDTAVIIFISLLLNQFIGALIFLSVFSVLRLFTGGYHANTYFGCLMALIVLYLLYEGLTVVILQNYLLLNLILFWSVSLFIIILYAPLDNEHKLLNDKEKKRFKKKSIVLSISLFLIAVITFFILKSISLSLSIVIFEVSILIFYGTLRKERKVDEKKQNS